MALCAPVVCAQDAAVASGPRLVYESVFDQYRGFDAQAIAPWIEANRIVGEIGGWAVYAREAQLPDPPAHAMAPKEGMADKNPMDGDKAGMPAAGGMHDHHGTKP